MAPPCFLRRCSACNAAFDSTDVAHRTWIRMSWLHTCAESEEYMIVMYVVFPLLSAFARALIPVNPRLA